MLEISNLENKRLKLVLGSVLVLMIVGSDGSICKHNLRTTQRQDVSPVRWFVL